MYSRWYGWIAPNTAFLLPRGKSFGFNVLRVLKSDPLNDSGHRFRSGKPGILAELP